MKLTTLSLKHGATLSMTTKPKWLIVDVSSWAYRDLHAAGPGEACVRNFTRRLALCREELRPSRIVLCFDAEGSFRRDLDPTYKANRDESPVGLDELIERIRQHAADEEIDCVSAPGFEADDCMATLAGIAIDQGQRVVLASRDKDLRQCLIGGGVNMLLDAQHGKHAADFEYFTAADLDEFYGLRPDQWIEYQMLVGDTSDNVPGCPGVGDKYAREILRKCSTLERFVSRSFEAAIPASKRNAVLRFLKNGDAEKMRRLVTLRHDAPLPGYWFEEVVA